MIRWNRPGRKSVSDQLHNTVPRASGDSDNADTETPPALSPKIVTLTDLISVNETMIKSYPSMYCSKTKIASKRFNGEQFWYRSGVNSLSHARIPSEYCNLLLHPSQRHNLIVQSAIGWKLFSVCCEESWNLFCQPQFAYRGRYNRTERAKSVLHRDNDDAVRDKIPDCSLIVNVFLWSLPRLPDNRTRSLHQSRKRHRESRTSRDRHEERQSALIMLII